MSTGPVGFEHLLVRMPRWFVEHALKTQARGRRRRAAQAARFELAYARPAPAHDRQPWPDTVAVWQPH